LEAQPPAGDPERTIIVPGVGRLTVEPDLATIRLGVAITRPTATEAREAAAAIMTSVIDALVATGIERRDLRTTLVGLSPITDYSPERGPRVTGYQLTNTVEATVRQLPAAGAVIDAALAAGATSLDGLDFRLEDRTGPEAAARRAAVDDARRRADVLAEAAGVRLGPVVGIVEGPRGGVPIPRGGRGPLAMTAEADTPIEAGSQELVVSVVVTFSID
jgi:uncharacterized protein YggE